MINNDELQEIVGTPKREKVNFRFEYFKAFRFGVDPLWYWRMKSGNGRIIADGGEGYDSESNVKRAITRITKHLRPNSFTVKKGKK